VVFWNHQRGQRFLGVSARWRDDCGVTDVPVMPPIPVTMWLHRATKQGAWTTFWRACMRIRTRTRLNCLADQPETHAGNAGRPQAPDALCRHYSNLLAYRIGRTLLQKPTNGATKPHLGMRGTCH